jgi:hypothetical protein
LVDDIYIRGRLSLRQKLVGLIREVILLKRDVLHNRVTLSVLRVDHKLEKLSRRGLLEARISHPSPRLLLRLLLIEKLASILLPSVPRLLLLHLAELVHWLEAAHRRLLLVKLLWRHHLLVRHLVVELVVHLGLELVVSVSVCTLFVIGTIAYLGN